MQIETREAIVAAFYRRKSKKVVDFVAMRAADQAREELRQRISRRHDESNMLVGPSYGYGGQGSAGGGRIRKPKR